MTVLIQYPVCNRRRSLKNSTCAQCSLDLARAVEITRVNPSDRVRYVVSYRDAAGKQVMEAAGVCLKDAGPWMPAGKPRPWRALSFREERNWTFEDTSRWYLEQESVKQLKSFDIIKIRLAQFGKIQKNAGFRARAHDLKNCKRNLQPMGRRRNGRSNRRQDPYSGPCGAQGDIIGQAGQGVLDYGKILVPGRMSGKRF